MIMGSVMLELKNVTEINGLISALEQCMEKGAMLDTEAEMRGYHVGCETRRKLRDNIRTLGGTLLRVWDTWEAMHLTGECEHVACPVNDMTYSEITNIVREHKDNVQDFMKTADELDAEAGTEIVPDPPQQDPQQMLMNFLKNLGINPN